jgi:hypothetical protein
MTDEMLVASLEQVSGHLAAGLRVRSRAGSGPLPAPDLVVAAPSVGSFRQWRMARIDWARSGGGLRAMWRSRWLPSSGLPRIAR